MKPTIKSITSLLVALKADICDDYRASEEDEIPGMLVTVSTNESADEWSYQTGDNSYTGSCYGHPFWSVIYLYRDSNCRALAREAVNELMCAVWGAKDCANYVPNAVPA